MPVRRTPDGKIIEEKTQLQRPGSPNSEGPTTVDPASTRPPQTPPAGGSRFDAETKVVRRDDSAPSAQPETGSASEPAAQSPSSSAPPAADDNRTRLVGFGASEGNTTSEANTEVATQDGPVTGWLVVVKGPGRGRFAAVGLGRNPVGRSPQARVCLNFGDDTISRDSHIVISYDHRGRQFFLQPGEGQNLSYLNDQPVLNTVPLEDGALLALGNTEVKFVAFCGQEFDWSDAE